MGYVIKWAPTEVQLVADYIVEEMVLSVQLWICCFQGRGWDKP